MKPFNFQVSIQNAAILKRQVTGDITYPEEVSANYEKYGDSTTIPEYYHTTDDHFSGTHIGTYGYTESSEFVGVTRDSNDKDAGSGEEIPDFVDTKVLDLYMLLKKIMCQEDINYAVLAALQASNSYYDSLIHEQSGHHHPHDHVEGQIRHERVDAEYYARETGPHRDDFHSHEHSGESDEEVHSSEDRSHRRRRSYTSM